MAKRRKKVEVDLLPDPPEVLQEKARAVECFLGAAQSIINEEILTDEQLISSMIIAVVVLTKMALLTGKYEGVTDEQACDDLVRLITFAFSETTADHGTMQ